MNNLILKIKSLFKPKEKFHKKGVNPHKHWRMILSIFMFIVLLLITFSLYLLYQIKNDKIFKVEKIEQTPQSLLNEKLFERVMKDFDSKNIKAEEVKSSVKVVPDPSI